MIQSVLTGTRPHLRAALLAALGVHSLTACGSEGDDAGSGGGGVGFGGAQDIGAFRAILEAGGIPGPDTLDASGFFAEHYAETPEADCGQPICLVTRMAVGRNWVSDEDEAVLQLSMATPIQEVERLPLDLTVVVNTSGSMSEDRIGYARAGLHELIDELDPADRMALVSYSDGVMLRWDLTQGLDREALHAAVNGLYAGGGTNIHDGLERGLSLALATHDFERQSRVLLVSDGLATTGIVGDAEIVGMAVPYLADGIALSTIGVGLDFNVALMRELAERGAGRFYFLDAPVAITEVFREELETSMTPIALDAELDVQTAGGWVIGEGIGSRAWNGAGPAGNARLPALFLASREGDDPGELGRRGAGGAILVRVTPAAGDVWNARGPVAEVSLRFRIPGTGEIIEESAPVTSQAEPSSDPDQVWLSQESMAEHYAMRNLFLGLRDATWYADSSDYGCALATLERLDERAARWASRTGDADVIADRMLIAQFADNLRAAGAVDEGQACSPPSYESIDDVPPYCAIGGSGAAPRGAALVALALFGLGYRRRRRASATRASSRRAP